MRLGNKSKEGILDNQPPLIPNRGFTSISATYLNPAPLSTHLAPPSADLQSLDHRVDARTRRWKCVTRKGRKVGENWGASPPILVTTHGILHLYTLVLESGHKLNFTSRYRQEGAGQQDCSAARSADLIPKGCGHSIGTFLLYKKVVLVSLRTSLGVTDPSQRKAMTPGRSLIISMGRYKGEPSAP